jgi:hypothetical protein
VLGSPAPAYLLPVGAAVTVGGWLEDTLFGPVVTTSRSVENVLLATEVEP